MVNHVFSGDRQAAWAQVRRIGTLAALATVPLAAAGAAAVADDPVPQPSSCAGFAATDASGDQTTVLDPGEGLTDNLDITGVFFRYAKNAAGSRVLTANLKVKNLDKTTLRGMSTEWFVRYSDPTAADQRVAGARVDDTGNVTYYEDIFPWDSIPPNFSGAPARTGGQFHEGPNGVIVIEIPEDREFADKTLTDVFAQSFEAAGPIDRDGPFALQADRAPDSGFGASYKVEPCLADEGEATATATATTTAEPTPTADPDPTPTADPDPTPTPDRTPAAEPTPPPNGDTPPVPSNTGGPAGTTGALELTVTRRVVRARSKRIPRGRVLKFAVSTREPLAGLTAALTRRSRVVGRARLARLTRAATLRLKLNRAIRRGTYALALTATRADGSRGTIAVKIAVR